MNITELAKHLDISPSTVSRVLSGRAKKFRISAKTVERVNAAAKTHRVSPDPLGSGLRRGSLGMIGLLVPDITNPFFSHLARAIELALRDHGMTIQLSDSAEDAGTEVTLAEQMLRRRLDGLILAPVGRASAAIEQLLEAAPMPIVLVDRLLPSINAPSVGIDNFAAGKLAAECLLESGHRDIGCLRGDPESVTDQERFRGVCAALGSSRPPRSLGAGYSESEGLAAARAMLSSHPPTSVISLGGQGVLGLLRAAKELRVSIPEDVAVVAFDEHPFSEFLSPPLTTIAQPVAEIASTAVTLLNALMKEDATNFEAIQLPVSLKLRGSERFLG